MVLEHTQRESNDIELICEEATQFKFLWLVRVETLHIQSVWSWMQFKSFNHCFEFNNEILDVFTFTLWNQKQHNEYMLLSIIDEQQYLNFNTKHFRHWMCDTISFWREVETCERCILIEIKLCNEHIHFHRINHINDTFEKNILIIDILIERLMKWYLKTQHEHQHKFQNTQQKFFDKRKHRSIGAFYYV